MKNMENKITIGFFNKFLYENFGVPKISVDFKVKVTESEEYIVFFVEKLNMIYESEEKNTEKAFEDLSKALSSVFEDDLKNFKIFETLKKYNFELTNQKENKALLDQTILLFKVFRKISEKSKILELEVNKNKKRNSSIEISMEGYSFLDFNKQEQVYI